MYLINLCSMDRGTSDVAQGISVYQYVFRIYMFVRWMDSGEFLAGSDNLKYCRILLV